MISGIPTPSTLMWKSVNHRRDGRLWQAGSLGPSRSADFRRHRTLAKWLNSSRCSCSPKFGSVPKLHCRECDRNLRPLHLCAGLAVVQHGTPEDRIGGNRNAIRRAPDRFEHPRGSRIRTVIVAAISQANLVNFRAWSEKSGRTPTPYNMSDLSNRTAMAASVV